MFDELRRLALFTSGVAELSRDRAEKLVKKAVKGGEIRRGQASSAVKSLLDASRQNRKELLGLIRSELQSQIANLGVATARDVARLERRVNRLEERAKSGATRPASKSTQKKRAGSKPAGKTARKSTATKTSAAPKPASAPTSGS